MLTFCGAVGPLDETVKIYDALIIHGLHYNVFCVSAIILGMSLELCLCDR